MKKLLLATALTAALPTAAVAAEDWQFSLSPYLWLAGVEGDVATIRPLPPAPIDVSPSDAVEDTETSYMVIFLANKGRHGLLMDFIYTDVQSDENLIKEFNLKMRSTSKNTVFSLAYTYQLYSEGETSLDTFAGARYWDIDTTLKFSGGQGLLAGRKINDTEDWIDPLVGLKGRMPLGNSRFYLAGWAGVGGFGVNADSFYDISVNLGYQWNEAIGTTLGYRVFDVDYEEGDFLYDAQQYGVDLGLTWRF